LFYKEN